MQDVIGGSDSFAEQFVISGVTQFIERWQVLDLLLAVDQTVFEELQRVFCHLGSHILLTNINSIDHLFKEHQYEKVQSVNIKTKNISQMFLMTKRLKQ